MADFDLMRRLTVDEGGKIMLLVMDGLGGLPREQGGLTELETANTPNMDRLAADGSLGMTIPVARGVSPGSGPAHLGLFGYDPLVYDIGRGVLEGIGIGLDVNEGDVAVRGNFCTVDSAGNITDRRAGRISTEEGDKRVQLLQNIPLDGVTAEVRIAEGYRFALVLRGEGMSPDIADTDPQITGVPPLAAQPSSSDAPTEAAIRTAGLVNQWIAEAGRRLQGHEPANAVTLRGFATDPKLPRYKEVYKLDAACIAIYPMYKGVARLVGMDIIETDHDDTPAQQFERVAKVYDQYSFFFVHIKPTDSRGEDGNFDAKVQVIEQVDAALPILTGLDPAVMVITGDHSTPATFKAHTWHPVPTLLYAPGTHMTDRAQFYGERECMSGALGQFPAADLMPLALAHAKRLIKYGA